LPDLAEIPYSRFTHNAVNHLTNVVKIGAEKAKVLLMGITEMTFTRVL